MLTYMATLSKLCDDKVLLKGKGPLGPGRFYERGFYAFPGFVDWIKNEVKNRPTGRINSAMTPNEQLVERLRQWMAGEPMAEGPMFHDMRPSEDGVWELKTHDLRIFGWLYRPREFIAVCGGHKDDYEEPTKIKTYADDKRRVIAARDALPLDGAKFVIGKFHELV